MESPRIILWRYEYLLEIEKYRSESYLIVYLDEIWFDSHDTTRLLRSNSIRDCSVLAPLLRWQKVVLFQVGNTECFVSNFLLLNEKQLLDSYADYHNDRNIAVFQN